MKGEITISRIEYCNDLIDAAEVGAKKALIDSGIINPLIKKSEAEKIYKASTIKKLLKAGLISFKKEGDRNHSIYIDRLQLLAAIKTYYKI